MKIVFLLTDQCFLFTMLLLLASTIYGFKSTHTQQAYHHLIKNPAATATGVILLFFLSIGILDSIHLQTPLQLSSLLDYLLAPLQIADEKTYSAPFALTLYQPETTTEHLRLSYPPLFINTPHAVWLFVKITLLKTMGISFLGIICLWGLCSRGFKVKLHPATKSAFITFFCCLWFVLACYALSRALHILGTGKIGQDIFYYTVKSIRTGLIIGLFTTLFMLPLALCFGLCAGYFGGLVDDIIQYLYTTLSAVPGVLLISAAILSIQTYIANHPTQFKTLAATAEARLFALCLILGVTSWTNLCRLLRAETLKWREMDFIAAARMLGTPHWKILIRHLLPNLMHIILITVVLDFSFLVLAEAVLSYIGVGVSPLTISWGNMINAARLELAREPLVWWPVCSAFLFMFTLVLSSNLFADAVRDAFDPKLNQTKQ